MPLRRLDVGDAIELAEMLQFIRNWLATDPSAAASLARFIDAPGYESRDGARDMCAHLDRFGFLLGGNDGEYLLDPAPEGGEGF